jgi:hypothetical protein
LGRTPGDAFAEAEAGAQAHSSVTLPVEAAPHPADGNASI